MRKRKLQNMTKEWLEKRLEYLSKRQSKVPGLAKKTTVQMRYIKYQLRRKQHE